MIRHKILSIRTAGRGFTELTGEARRFVAEAGVADGLLNVFCRHTSASLVIQENADPDVRADLERFFARLVRDGDPLFQHTQEGPDDMSAHIRSALTQSQLLIPFANGRLLLGTWQGVYLWEHRTSRQTREVVLSVACSWFSNGWVAEGCDGGEGVFALPEHARHVG